MVAPERDTADEPAPDPMEQALLRWQIRVALARLTPEHREVIRLSYALRALRLALEEAGVLP